VALPGELVTLVASAVPPGRWAVGVSGGADSVALLLLFVEAKRPDVSLHVAHLDHETRQGRSTQDAQFVRDLAARLSVTATVGTRSEVEGDLPTVESNVSVRYRAARLALFRRIVREHDLDGVILAHHADDQAETVFQRLLRGSGPMGLAGMAPRTCVGGLTILRPLLSVRRETLRAALREGGEVWQEDESNASDANLRNRLRRVLEKSPGLTDALLELSSRCARLRDWVQSRTPAPAETLSISELLKLPELLCRQLGQRWLAHIGVPEDRIAPAVVDQLLAMATDAATPARQHFPGRVLVRRSRDLISAHNPVPPS
jgi:tRNA(Ile)-lysidine synthase